MGAIVAYQPFPTNSGAPRIRRSALHWMMLGLVWLAVASGAVVFSEPAPVDVLTMGLIVLLPLVGLVQITRSLVVFVGLWMLAAAAAFLASIASDDLARSTVHSAISVYLYLGCFVIAGFIARNPQAHTRLVLHAYLWAAFVTSVAGIVGYFGLLPGASDLFTKFGRAAGTFKDPNVYGPFLVPAVVYALHLAITRPAMRALFALTMAGFLAFAVLLSFSRGAWGALIVALALYCYLTFLRSPTNRQRVRLLALAAVAMTFGAVAIAYAVENPAIGDLMVERASVTQTYDEGPEGRFGGQLKAQSLILDNPFGIGALQFAANHHHEDVHNVYLSMFLNAGWIGGMIYLLMVSLTTVYGLNHALRRTETQPLFLVVYSAFVAHVFLGFLIDTDHWRHFYLLMALVWGLMVSDRQIVPAKAAPRRPARIPAVAIIRPRRPRRLLRPARPMIALVARSSSGDRHRHEPKLIIRAAG